jgi:hypothetical protein
MFHHFKLLPFLGGLVAGYVIFFILKPDTANADKVVKWPHPDNVDKTVYRDRNGLCYKFEAQIADCGKVKDILQPFAHE